MPNDKPFIFKRLLVSPPFGPRSYVGQFDTWAHIFCASLVVFAGSVALPALKVSLAAKQFFDYIRIMETIGAIESFAALAHAQRLAIFRMLIRTGPNGLSAGVIAQRLDTPPSSLSFHLSQLERAGLIRSHRESRHVIYAANIEGTRRLISYLTEDCCEGRPEICGDLAVAIEACGTEE